MSMTGKQIFIIASAFITEKEGDDAERKEFALPALNVLLQECLEAENANRYAHERTLLTAAPYLRSLDDTVDYCDQLTRVALPYGLVTHFYRNDDDSTHEAQFRNEYIAAVQDAATPKIGTIEDVYA